MRTIYSGKYIPDLAVEDDEKHGFFGWLFYKHPDGQWVSLADLKPLVDLFTKRS